MSIIIHFGPAPSLLQSNSTVPMIPSCVDETHTTLEMGPGFENDTGFSMMSADDSSIVDVSTTNPHGYSDKEKMTIAVPHQAVGTCFGLPYQDHNYGAPPPPTPPSYSPQPSPVHMSPIVEAEAETVVTTTVRCEEVNETSITRCVCGFEHDDEYMICCDKCLVWQHVDCMGLDRSKIPETYLCEQCEPRKVDRHKAKLLQAKKKVVLPEKLIFTETSEDSEEDHSNQNTDAPKTRVHRSSVKKKSDDEKDSKPEQPVLRKGKSPSKNSKERMEIKRSRFCRRAKSRTDSTCATDEEAQDAWKCAMDWPRRKSESSLDNQYSEEIHNLAVNLRNQTDEQKYGKQLQAQLCKAIDVEGQNKKLVAVSDLARDQVIIEFKGQFTSASLFHEKHPAFKQRIFPFVLFYKLRSNEELCVDATNYKSDAKYVRRSCQPNAEVHHFVVSGSLHLYILSIKDIKKDEEITIPFDMDRNLSTPDVVCACNSDKCEIQRKTSTPEPCEKRRKVRKSHISTDDDSNQSVCGPSSSSSSSPVKSSRSPSAKSPSPNQKVGVSPCAVASEVSEAKTLSEDQDTDDQAKDNKKKLTREERKLDAIMRAFDQMEKAAKRRQQALDRMAHQKAISTPKTEDSPEKQEGATCNAAKEEEKPAAPPPPASAPENSSVDEEKPSNNQTAKLKKGKRRRGSGTSSRKRTRTNSGGSDIFTADEASSACEGTTASPVTTTVTTTTATSTEISETVTVTTSEAVIPSVPQPTFSLAFPKTKRFLHHEWLQEKVESSAVSTPPCPLPIHKEVSYNTLAIAPTCYVRCTKDSPSSGGISAAHLRRSSISGHGKQPSGQGSAKKRWLRQAMYDNEPWEADTATVDVVNGSMSPLHGVCFSPHGQNDVGSPGVSPLDDVVTPLKKRRLMRKSIESLSSPKSPTAESTGASSGMSPDHSSCEPITDSLIDGTCSSESMKNFESGNTSSGINFVGKCVRTGNGLGKHLLKSLRENWIMNDCKMKSESSSNDDEQKSSENADTDAMICESRSQTKSSDSGEINFLGEITTSERYKNNVERESNGIAKCEKRAVDTRPSLLSSSTLKQNVKDFLSDSCSRTDLTKLRLDSSDDSFTSPASRHLPMRSLSDQSVNEYSCDSVRNVLAQNKQRGAVCSDLHKVSPSKVIFQGIDHSLKLGTLNETYSDKSSMRHISAIVKQEKCSSEVDGNDLLKAPELSAEPTNVGKVKDAALATTNSRLAALDSTANLSNCNVQNTSYAQKSISKKCTSQNVCSPVNMPVSHDNDASSVLVSSEICGDKVNVTETVPTDVKIDSRADLQKELNPAYESSENMCNKDSSVACSSATQKRKVSLSEYRQRKRDNPNTSQTNGGRKKNNNCILKSPDITEACTENEIKLASLPLFKKAESSRPLRHEKTKVATPRSVQKPIKEMSSSHEVQADDIPGQRENLSERLKREFGLEDDSDSCGIKDGSKHKMLKELPLPKVTPDIAPILSLCTQLPPPPPPPPSSVIPMVNANGSALPQFSYPPAQPPTYLVPPMPPTQYMPPQNPLGCPPIIPVIHTPPPPLQSNCSYAPSLHIPVTRPPYPPVNNQSYATLSQHIPHMPLPPTYPPPPFQSRVYK